MEMNVEKAKNVSLGNLSGDPMTLTIAGKAYSLCPLTMGDIASVERHIREQRLDLFIRKIVPGSMLDDTFAKSIAELGATKVTLQDVWASYEGQLRLLYQSLLRGGTKIQWQWMLDNMPHIEVKTLTELMMRITGLGDESTNGSDPTRSGNGTNAGTESTPASGTSSG